MKSSLTQNNKDNRTSREGKTIHKLFMDQVRRSPDKVAIVFEESKLTYAELNLKSDQLAQHIIKSISTEKFDQDFFIPLYVTKGPEMIIGMLAILKVGAAYVPIDTTYPKERIDYIFKETKAKIFLTQRGLMENKEWENSDIKAISIDLIEELYQDEIAADISNNCDFSSLAYVIYTSGTTGNPKGVTITHDNVLNLMDAQDFLQVSQNSRMLQFASFVFDVSVWEIFLALLKGAELFILSESLRKDAQLVHDYLESNKITVAFLPPVLLSVLPYSSLENLKTILVGGDVCSLELMRKWSNGRNLYNAYGPTENTVLSTMHRFKEGDSNLNIGKPFQGAEAFVLDSDRNLVPPGLEGELHLAGKGIASGYLNQPKLTAEKFVTNPFFNEQSQFEKLYRTGDLVRQLDNGDLEYIRRIDTQVKINGFRVELGEIESVLLNIPGIIQCCVVAKTIKLSTGDSKQLIAYYAENGNTEFSVKTVRDKLSRKLPYYMVPYSFIRLEEFPISLNGKIDKKALPEAIEWEGDEFVLPRNKFESQLVQIIKNLLGLDSLSCSANFFECGGNSLLATMFIAQVRKQCNVEIPIRLFLSKPVIMDLVDFLAENKGTDNVRLPKVIQIERTKENLYNLTFPQTAIWVLNEISPVSLAYNTQFAITFSGELNIQILKRTINELVKRHESLRSTFHSINDQVKQKIHPSFDFAIEEISIAKLNPIEKQFELAAIRARCCEQKFDISQLPLFKWSLVEVEKNHHELIVVEHHFVHDGKSVTVLLNEIGSIYSRLLSNDVCDLPPLGIQMVDFAAWQQNYIKSDLYTEGLAYWKKKLEDYRYLSFPNDFGEPSFKSYSGECIDTAIPENLYEKILHFARSNKTSFFIVMLSAFKVFLNKYSSEIDLTIGSSVANRRMVEFGKLIGMCVNTIALRTKLNTSASFLEFMELVEETVHEAQHYQDVPFSELVKEIVHDREINKNPIFGISFNFHDHQMPTIEWPEVSGKFKFLSNGSSKFDLSVLIMPPSNHNPESFVRFEYATNQFKRQTVSKIGAMYFDLIEQLISMPEQSISEVSIISEQGEELLLQNWNKTDVDYSVNTTIHGFFAQQVKKTPLATAVIFEKQKLTYDELNRKSNQLARYIRQKYFENTGEYLQPETVIPVCFERSLEMIIGMMAVLKAGATFVAINPNHPRKRIEFILRDTEATLVLSSNELSNLIELSNDQKVLVDLKENNYTKMDDSDFATQNTQLNIAFVFYNTGTAKCPDGIRTTHRALLNVANYFNNRYKGEFENYNAAMVINPGIDFSIQQVLSTILFGNTLHMFAEETLSSPKKFLEYMELNDIEVLGITPTLYSHLMLPSLDYKNTKLRLVHFGGEYLTTKDVNGFWSEENTSKIKILYSWGPVDYVSNATCCELNREMLLNGENDLLPVGKPIDNTRIYVLDSNLKPVPIGVIGELYVTGSGLSPECPGSHFNSISQYVVNCFATQNDVLKGYDYLYKTGDLVRWRDDGNLEYFRRKDNQVRRQGYIFELDEIEKELCLTNGIERAQVILKDGKIKGRNTSYLIAYYSLKQEGEPISELEILQSLSSEVPDFMMPDFLLRLDSFSMNSLDGVDKLKLPEPDLIHAQDYVAPKDEVKDAVVRIWKEVLGLEDIAIEDNFFQLGGDSLLAIRAAYKMSSVLGYNVKVDEIFRFKSISQFFQNEKNPQPDDSNLIWKF